MGAAGAGAWFGSASAGGLSGSPLCCTSSSSPSGSSCTDATEGGSTLSSSNRPSSSLSRPPRMSPTTLGESSKSSRTSFGHESSEATEALSGAFSSQSSASSSSTSPAMEGCSGWMKDEGSMELGSSSAGNGLSDVSVGLHLISSIPTSIPTPSRGDLGDAGDWGDLRPSSSSWSGTEAKDPRLAGSSSRSVVGSASGIPVETVVRRTSLREGGPSPIAT
mmetsp:Transcript_87869/g.192742  ORF Transcript_87869/g.192742 Transcript_87869/m.192742 type:complete len:220 (+) Transcript_87869:796-1455(+)